MGEKELERFEAWWRLECFCAGKTTASREIALAAWRVALAQPAAQAVAWRYVPSQAWGAHVFTDDPKQAALAREMGCKVDALGVIPPDSAQPAAPAVWKLVPERPSEEMVSRGVEAQVATFYTEDDTTTAEDVRWRMTRACYEAMLAAAPEVKP